MRKPPTGKPKISHTEVRFDRNSVVKLFGQRMKEARELNKMTQIDAAERLGYMNSSKLNKIEHASDGDTIPPFLPYKASIVYQVSTDFLYGHCDDWERDPVVYQQRQIGHWLFDHWERAKAAEINAIRVLSNKLLACEKAATHAVTRSLQLKELVERFRAINAEFDDLKLGAKLLRFAEETAEEAAGLSAELKRFHAYADVADKSANVRVDNMDMFKQDGE